MKYLFQEEIQKKIFFQGQFTKKRVSFSRIMVEIPNQGVKFAKKLSDSIKKQEKDNFIFCLTQKMNLFKKTKEKRYFGLRGGAAGYPISWHFPNLTPLGKDSIIKCNSKERRHKNEAYWNNRNSEPVWECEERRMRRMPDFLSVRVQDKLRNRESDLRA